MSDSDGRQAQPGPGAGTGGSAPRWPSLRPEPASAPSRRDQRVAAAAEPEPAAPVSRRTGSHAVVPPPAAPAGAAAGGTPAAGAPAGGTPAGGTPAEPAPGARRRRRRGRVIAAIVAAVVLVGGGITAFLLLRDGDTTVAAPDDVVLPSPTATVAPVARAATTPFATSLPATVLQYALASSADDPAPLGPDALEAYAETYTDGASGTVTVQAAQFETPEEAAAALAGVIAALPAAPAADPAASTDPAATPAAGAPTVLLQDEVLVGGQATGTVTVVDVGDGTGVAAWSNGTTVFRVAGPAADIRNLYAAYPL